MKRTLVTLMALFLAFALVACGVPASGGDSEGASSSPVNQAATDDTFSSLSWSGTEVEFTVKEVMTLLGISVFAGDEEYEGNIVSNSEGNMGFANGTMLTPGSAIGFHGGLIIFSGTSASCAIDTGGATPDRVVFSLADGQTLERAL